MRTYCRLWAVLLLGFWLADIALAEEFKVKNTLDTKSFDANPGFFNFYWDDSEGRIWIELLKFQEPFLYVSSLATGLGSNPVGLDRGQLGDSRIVHFRKVGKQVFLVQENWSYRATSESDAERRAVRESFAESILWSGTLQAGADGENLVDLSTFLLRDAHDCLGTLKAADQGDYALDQDRSHVYRERSKSFPDNTEFEVALTFKSNKPGALAGSVAADGKAITLRQHHSFIKLPAPGYRPRKFDPRVGSISITYADYGMPIDAPLEQRLITRHRLEKSDPAAALSSAKEPIVYFVDPGTPQPIRDALIEGASWWQAAFESAGFENAFQVRVLPEDADPMDVRYNMIQWVHRSTRGWSYGQSVIDPRTGEILKGHVLLGSLRVRQDRLLFEGLKPSVLSSRAGICDMGQFPGPEYLAQLEPSSSTTEIALARIRQLSAHEVGHTLGFAHNFAASTYMDRASVMDYPAPRTKIADGKIDLSDAYAVGIGEWDKFTVQYAYSEFAEGEDEQLTELVNSALSRKMLYLTDADARPAGAAHPLANLWDNGSDPVAALNHEMAVRRIALANLDATSLADGQSMSELEKVLVPIYLHHRYQVEATAKMLGGYDYTYAVKGDGQIPQVEINSLRQAAALNTLLKTIEPVELVIPQRIVDLIPPRIGTSASDQERFESTTSPIFDQTTAIRAATELTLGCILQPQRASRLARHTDANWGLLQVIDYLIASTVERAAPSTAAELEAHRIVQRVLVEKLISLAAAQSATHDARALARLRLQRLDGLFKQQQGQTSDGISKAHQLELISQIERFLDRPAMPADPSNPVNLPPGSPIGQ